MYYMYYPICNHMYYPICMIPYYMYYPILLGRRPSDKM